MDKYISHLDPFGRAIDTNGIDVTGWTEEEIKKLKENKDPLQKCITDFRAKAQKQLKD